MLGNRNFTIILDKGFFSETNILLMERMEFRDGVHNVVTEKHDIGTCRAEDLFRILAGFAVSHPEGQLVSQAHCLATQFPACYRFNLLILNFII
jgi:hypothetical protein